MQYILPSCYCSCCVFVPVCPCRRTAGSWRCPGWGPLCCRSGVWFWKAPWPAPLPGIFLWPSWCHSAGCPCRKRCKIKLFKWPRNLQNQTDPQPDPSVIVGPSHIQLISLRTSSNKIFWFSFMHCLFRTRMWRGCPSADWWTDQSEGRRAVPAGCPSWAACTHWPCAGHRFHSTYTRG